MTFQDQEKRRIHMQNRLVVAGVVIVSILVIVAVIATIIWALRGIDGELF
jgi:preprotein translocase subunit Sec61beta